MHNALAHTKHPKSMIPAFGMILGCPPSENLGRGRKGAGFAPIDMGSFVHCKFIDTSPAGIFAMVS